MLLVRKMAENPVALAGDVQRDLIWHSGRWRPGSRRVGEDVQVGKRQIFNGAVRLFKLDVGLAGEANHNIGADGGSRHGGANLFNLLAIVPWTVAAIHSA